MMEKESIEMNLLNVICQSSAKADNWLQVFCIQDERFCLTSHLTHPYNPGNSLNCCFTSYIYCVYQLEPGRALQAFMVLPYRLHYKTFCNLQAPLEPSIATHEKKSEIKFEILFEK